MTRLFDRLRDDLVTDDLRTQILGGGKYQPVVFEITNVVEYHNAHAATYSDLGDFPNVAPPFGCYWMEWRQAPNALLPTSRVGVLILGTDGAGDPLPGDARWSIAFIVFVEGRGQRAQRLADWILLIDADGHIKIEREDIGKPWIDLIVPPRKPEPLSASDKEADRLEIERLKAEANGDVRRLRDMAAALEDKASAVRENFDAEARETLPPYMRRLLHPVLLAHSLMACKNVDYEDHRPPERLSRKHRRKKGEPLVSFRTLLIRPMGGARQHADKIDVGDGATAFHIVRGHFKTYTADRPLFGRRVGTYWWSPMTRGDREHGEVVKDYVVAGDSPTTASQNHRP